MIAGLQDGDIIDADEVELISSVVESLAWIVSFCNEHPEWFGTGVGAEHEWLENANKLLKDVDDQGA